MKLIVARYKSNRIAMGYENGKEYLLFVKEGEIYDENPKEVRIGWKKDPFSPNSVIRREHTYKNIYRFSCDWEILETYVNLHQVQRPHRFQNIKDEYKIDRKHTPMGRVFESIKKGE